MDTSQFTSRVKRIRIDSIEVNPDNPRGEFDTSKDPSFERLAESVKRMGVLVPLVVRKLRHRAGAIRYQLVDGERRYWAAKTVGRRFVPAHILHTHISPSGIRKVMFHLHMTREQWGPWAQCRALEEIYPALEAGIPVSKKDEWIQRIHKETSTSPSTARDRVRVLCWSKALKQKINDFTDRNPKYDVYSYILAIEASVVEPSIEAFPEYYVGPRTTKANLVRERLLDKTLGGIETGTITSREAIRSVDGIFAPGLSDKNKKIALEIFKALVDQPGYLYEDAKAEIAVRLPEVFAEKPPKPRRLITQMESLANALLKYEPQFVDQGAKSWKGKKKLRGKFLKALRKLEKAVAQMLEKFDATA